MDGAESKIKDPVCGRTIEKATAWKEWYANTPWHFCSEECWNRFRTRPPDYIPQTG